MKTEVKAGIVTGLVFLDVASFVTGVIGLVAAMDSPDVQNVFGFIWLGSMLVWLVPAIVLILAMVYEWACETFRDMR